MKLSVVIVCWNDLGVIKDCLESIFGQKHQTEFEVLVSDNGSTDGSVEHIKEHFPQVRVLANGANLGFSKANNVGIQAAAGEYTLILNPDTICHEAAFDKWMRFAEAHPEAGAFGCRVVNADGSFHAPAQVFPTVGGYWSEAFYMHGLARFHRIFGCGEYPGWDGLNERPIDWQSGCCVLFRSELLRNLGGFDERFFYNFEEVDLCKRVWDSGHSILYTPEPVFTHLWGQSTKRFPIRFAIEKLRNRYRYFFKHYGIESVERCRRATSARLWVRRIVFSLKGLAGADESLKERLKMYRVVLDWNARLDVREFIRTGAEPDVGYLPLAPAPAMMA